MLELLSNVKPVMSILPLFLLGSKQTQSPFQMLDLGG